MKKVLACAIKDPRWEVRHKIVDAITKFKLEDLAPALIDAYRRDRSRKA